MEGDIGAPILIVSTPSLKYFFDRSLNSSIYFVAIVTVAYILFDLDYCSANYNAKELENENGGFFVVYFVVLLLFSMCCSLLVVLCCGFLVILKSLVSITHYGENIKRYIILHGMIVFMGLVDRLSYFVICVGFCWFGWDWGWLAGWCYGVVSVYANFFFWIIGYG